MRRGAGRHAAADRPAVNDRHLTTRCKRLVGDGKSGNACADDDLFIRHAKVERKFWRAYGANRLIRLAQARAERLARFNRKQVLKSDDWMDQSLPF